MYRGSLEEMRHYDKNINVDDFVDVDKVLEESAEKTYCECVEPNQFRLIPNSYKWHCRNCMLEWYN